MMLALIKYARNIWRRTAQDWQQFQYRRMWLAREVGIDPHAVIRNNPNAPLEIGSGTTIGAYTILDLNNPPIFPTGRGSKIIIGKRVAINEFNNIRASGGEVRIGDGCLISQFVSIIGSNHSISRDAFIRDQPWNLEKTGVIIDEDVWVGTHVVILPGVHICRGAVIAAGAVVTYDIPEFMIAAGVPARVIGQRE